MSEVLPRPDETTDSISADVAKIPGLTPAQVEVVRAAFVQEVEELEERVAITVAGRRALKITS